MLSSLGYDNKFDHDSMRSCVLSNCIDMMVLKQMCKNLFLCCLYLQVENVVLEVPFPKTVLNATLTPSQGKYSFDPVSKLMTWDIGKIDTSKLPNIKGTVSVVDELVGVGGERGEKGGERRKQKERCRRKALPF